MLTELYDRPAVTDALRISRHTLVRYIKSGKFPPPCKRTSNKQWWRKSQVEEWINGTEEGKAA